MIVKLNPDSDLVNLVQKGLLEKDGYCPGVSEKTVDSKCICKAFRDRLDDPAFEGYCPCGLYYKAKD